MCYFCLGAHNLTRLGDPSGSCTGCHSGARGGQQNAPAPYGGDWVGQRSCTGTAVVAAWVANDEHRFPDTPALSSLPVRLRPGMLRGLRSRHCAGTGPLRAVQGYGGSDMSPCINFRAAAVLPLCFGLFCPPALADKRVALVIGNGAYQHAPKLPNPTRDATAVAEMFRKAGFETVMTHSDLGNLEFKRALRDLLEAAQDADIAVLFYAGHGIQIGDHNYMVPIDAKLAREYDAKDEAISLERIVEALEPDQRLRLVILDACRDNPFIVNAAPRRTPAIPRGLARVEPTQVDTLIAYAAKAGSTASDGQDDTARSRGRCSSTSPSLGLDIRLAFRPGRDDVFKLTRSEQEPFVYGSLGGSNISLVPAPTVPQGRTVGGREGRLQTGREDQQQDGVGSLHQHPQDRHSRRLRASGCRRWKARSAAPRRAIRRSPPCRPPGTCETHGRRNQGVEQCEGFR